MGKGLGWVTNKHKDHSAPFVGESVRWKDLEYMAVVRFEMRFPKKT